MPGVEHGADGGEELKHTPLEAEHRALGAKLGPFGGWLMPIEYAGALSEHRAVRERVGLFDLTHLGKVEVVKGPGALGMLQGVVTNDVSRIAVGEAQYNLVLNEGGGVIEDLIIYYRLGDDRFFVVPNASNTQRVLQILGEAEADQRLHLMYHQDWCFVAVQGPESTHVVRGFFPEADGLGFMQCVESEYRRRPVMVDRSGYTARSATSSSRTRTSPSIWRALTEAATAFDGRPAGWRPATCCVWRWGTPSTVRTCSRPPRRSRPDSRGPWRWTRETSAAARRSSTNGPRGCRGTLHGVPDARRRFIPRAHYPVFRGDVLIGEVTSGTFSPLLETGIALAYLWPADVAEPGDEVEVDIRGRRRNSDARAAPVRGSEPALTLTSPGVRRPGRGRRG